MVQQTQIDNKNNSQGANFMMWSQSSITWLPLWPQIGTNLSVQTRPSSVKSRIDTIQEVPVIMPEKTKPFDIQSILWNIQSKVWNFVLWWGVWWALWRKAVSDVFEFIPSDIDQNNQQMQQQVDQVDIVANTPELWGITQKELDFLTKVKQQWLDPMQAINFVKQKRREEWDSEAMKLSRDSALLSEDLVWFVEWVWESYVNRLNNIKEALWASKRWEQWQTRWLFQSAWQVFGFGWDVIWEAFMSGLSFLDKNLLWWEWSAYIVDVAERAQQDPIVQKWIELLGKWLQEYEEFAENNPATARDIEALLAMVDFGLNFVWWTVAQKWLREWTEQSLKLADDVVARWYRKLQERVWQFKRWWQQISRETAQSASSKLAGKAPINQRLSDSLLASINKMDPSKIRDFTNRFGVHPSEWSSSRGIIDNPDIAILKLTDRFDKYKTLVDDVLGEMNNLTVKPRNVLDKTDKDYLKLMIDDVVKYSDEVVSPQNSRFVELQKKYELEWLTPSEINEIKRYFEKNNRFDYLKEWNAKGARRSTEIDSQVREFLLDYVANNGFPQMRQINREIAASKFLWDNIASKQLKQSWNELISLSDFVILAWIEWWWGVPALALKSLYNNKNIRAKIARRLNRRKTIEDPNVDIQAIKQQLIPSLPNMPVTWPTPSTIVSPWVEIISWPAGNVRRWQIIEWPIPTK